MLLDPYNLESRFHDVGNRDQYCSISFIASEWNKEASVIYPSLHRAKYQTSISSGYSSQTCFRPLQPPQRVHQVPLDSGTGVPQIMPVVFQPKLEYQYF